MAGKLKNEQLLRVSKAKNIAIQEMKWGVYLHVRSGRSIEDLLLDAVSDRFALAEKTLRSARRASGTAPPNHRLCTARSYYAMYHALRAVIFFVEQGDDHEEHSKLPSKFPNDFPNWQQWQNDLKTARLERNRADYDPYPKTDKAFATTSSQMLSNAERFVRVAKTYLIGKGCRL